MSLAKLSAAAAQRTRRGAAPTLAASKTASYMRFMILIGAARAARALSAGAWPAHAYAKELAAAVEAVEAASVVTSRLQRDLGAVERVSKDDASPVTVADVAAQAVVIGFLKRRFPDDAFIAEESASEPGRSPNCTFAFLVRREHPVGSFGDVRGRDTGPS